MFTVRKELALIQAGNYALTSSIFHELPGNFGWGVGVLHVTRHFQLAQKFGKVIVSAGIGSLQSREIGPRYNITTQEKL